MASSQRSVSANTYIEQHINGASKDAVQSVVDPVRPDPQYFVLDDIPPLEPLQVSEARGFRSYHADLPPDVNVWVGRNDELSLLQEIRAGVVVITGIGGQGKSALAAKALQRWQAEDPSRFWDWRDCREEGDRFLTQLASLVFRVTSGAVDRRSLY